MADAEHGLDMVLKDVRKNIEKGLATAKVEWEDAIKRGQKPLEQVHLPCTCCVAYAAKE
jgi:hypothetical protein